MYKCWEKLAHCNKMFATIYFLSAIVYQWKVVTFVHFLFLFLQFCGNSAHSQAHVGVKSQSSFTEGIRVPFTQSKDPTGNQNWYGLLLSIVFDWKTPRTLVEVFALNRPQSMMCLFTGIHNLFSLKVLSFLQYVSTQVIWHLW